MVVRLACEMMCTRCEASVRTTVAVRMLGTPALWLYAYRVAKSGDRDNRMWSLFMSQTMTYPSRCGKSQGRATALATFHRLASRLSTRHVDLLQIPDIHWFFGAGSRSLSLQNLSLETALLQVR
jgi:hypothetical protein